MRVSELANELGRTSKEIIEIIKKKEGAAALYAASSMTKEQEEAARSAFSGKRRKTEGQLLSLYRRHLSRQSPRRRRASRPAGREPGQRA